MSALELVAFDVVPLWTALIKVIVVLTVALLLLDGLGRR
jgi:hypothetical protein